MGFYNYLIEGNSMSKKILCIVVVGLLFVLVAPAGCSFTSEARQDTTTISIDKPLSQLEIKIKGGNGIHAFIKNTGTTDVHISEMKLNLDGRVNYNMDSGSLDIKAGKTKLVIFVVFGFGATNIELTLDSTTQTASGNVLFGFVYGVG
jgi:hypothetical protein